MNDKDEIEYKMFNSTLEAMMRNQVIWLGNLNIESYVDRLRLIIRQLANYSENKKNSPKGITIEKNKIRKELIIEAFAIKQSLLIYYRNNQLKANIALFDYHITKLNVMTDDSLYMEVTRILEKAVELALSLLPIGITQAMIDTLAADIKDFYKQISLLQLALKLDIENNEQITLKIAAGKSLLKDELDVSISIYESTFPKFTKIYRQSRRRIKKPGKHKAYKVAIKGTVTDSITKLPVANVTVTAGLKKEVTTTDIKGNYQIKIFKKDAISITFSLPEKYNDKTLNIPKK